MKAYVCSPYATAPEVRDLRATVSQLCQEQEDGRRSIASLKGAITRAKRQRRP